MEGGKVSNDEGTDEKPEWSPPTMSAKDDSVATEAADASPARRDKRAVLLIPYVLLVALYMHIVQPLVYRLPLETFSVALAKATPIWYLACYVGLCPRYYDNPLSKCMRAGLVLSSLGDMCLVWRQTLFLPGMLFFSLAHVAYICGLRSWMRRGTYPPAAGYRRAVILACSAGFLFIFPAIDSWFMAVCAAGYSALIVVTALLMGQRYFTERNTSSLCGMVGAAAFIVSDALIGVTKWRFTFPFSELIIMVTYYTAQAAIAVGAVYSERLDVERLAAAKKQS